MTEPLTICRDATPADWLYIDSLRKKEGDALGFIPKETYQGILEHRLTVTNRRYAFHSRILIVEDNGDLTGFSYTSYQGDIAKIFQIVVQQDARRWHRAMLMIDAVESDARAFGKTGISCRVAFDLESNHFWRAIGFVPVRQVVSTWLNQKESKSKRPLWVYHKEFMSLFSEVGLIA